MSGAPVTARWGTAALLAAFALLGALRMNGFSLLEPDSPEYLFGARSLASFQGYREIDRPGEPLHTLRPPGLPLLLAPLSAAAPYAVVGAKLVVLAVALLALVLTVRLAARAAPESSSVVAGLLVASSPYALIHATEVMTEFPYLACCLAAILVMTRTAAPPSRREIALAAALLSFLPFLRTIGLALVVATIVWCAIDRSRRAFWPAPAAALAAYGVWSARNGLTGGPTYFGSIAAELKHVGPAAFAAKSAAAAAFYAGRSIDVLLPGVRPGRPLYERMTVSGAPDLGGLHGLGLALGLAIVALAAFGAWSRRRRDGTLIALYVALFLAVLSIYPPRHERLTWPLVPIFWALVPSGLLGIVRPYRHAALAIAAALVVWQAGSSVAIVRDNLAWARAGERFYAERVPPIYFADWRAAGSWLREHAAAGSRVLTRHSDLGFTSGLKQESVRFEELPPQEWRGRIAKLHARYLAVPATLFGKFFPFDLLDADPAYSYVLKWKGRDAAVLEVLPNRSGRVRIAAPTSGDDASACDSALSREPLRVDLTNRCAEILAAAGRRDEAIARLEARIARGGADVRVLVTLGQLLLQAGANERAAAAFRASAALPEAELLGETIERGRIAAERPDAAGRTDALARARAFMDDLRWAEARVDLERALAEAPEDPAALAAAGELRMRLGEEDEAARFYRRAGERGDRKAAAMADALTDALGTEAAFGTAAPDAVLKAALFWAGTGAPGRALDVLERASVRFPAEPRIAARLGELRRFYGLD